MWEQTASAALFPQPPVVDFAEPPRRLKRAGLQVLKTRTRKVITLPIGKFRARETIWWNPATGRQYLSEPLRRLVAPASNFGYDVVVYVGRALFLEHQPVRQIRAQLARRHVHLSASTVDGLGRRFITLLALARRAREVHAQCQGLQAQYLTDEWRDNLPFHHLSRDLQALVQDRPLQVTLHQLETKIPVFDQLRQALRIAPVAAGQGLNHPGEPIDLPTVQKQVQTFVQQVRARPDYATTPAWAKMLAQIEKYEPKLFAAPLVVATPQGPRTIQPQRTNNIMEQFFRGFKRGCRQKTGDQALGRTLRHMLADTPLVANLRHPEYLKILLNGQPDLESRFAQIEPVTVRQELIKARQNPEKTPRSVKRFIAQLASSVPVKNFFENLKSNRILRS